MKKNIQSIERAFQILRVIHRWTDGVTIGDLAEETELHTSTVSRIVSTLENLGAIERVDHKLFIGVEIITLADQAPLTERLISLATPCLREVMAATNEAVGLTLIEGTECVVFYQIPSNHHIQIRDWTGERFPLHVTSSGKLYLAGLTSNEVDHFFEQPLPQIASGTKMSLAALREEFPQIRADGVAWTVDELEDGLTSVAAAIRDQKHNFVAGIYLSIPNYRVEDKNILAEHLRQAAEKISNNLS